MIAAALIAAGPAVVIPPPAPGAVPIPHVRPPVHPLPIHPPPSHPLPAPPEPASALDDIVREVKPSNDPNVYELPDTGVPPSVARSITPQPANDGDQRDDGTDNEAFTTDLAQDAGSDETAGAATVSTGPSSHAGSGDDNRPSLRSIGLIGAVLVSVGSLSMWLVRRT